MGEDLLESRFGDREAISLENNSDPDKRHWLITDGTGSFAAASLTGAKLSRYDGLCIALAPPVQRVNLLAGTDEILVVAENGTKYQLATNYWRDGSVGPEGWRLLKSFSYDVCPTWVFEVEEGWLVKQVAMLQSKRQLVLGYTWVSKRENLSVELTTELVVNFRDFHSETHGSQSWQFLQTVSDGQVHIKAYETAPSLGVTYNCGHYQENPSWWWGYFWPEEKARGLGDSEDCFHAGSIVAKLDSGKSLSICAGLGDVSPVSIEEAIEHLKSRKQELLTSAGSPQSNFARALTLAADQFVVQRVSSDSKSVIAGYPWFNDWGRDTMISLPGLCLATGRHQDARSILNTFGLYLSDGMLPNNFPDADEEPHYNTCDATLWWGWTLKEYLEATGDLNFIREQLPLLEDVVDWHLKGTRFGIKVDQEDGLISAGEPGVQLTWMDAKVGDYVVTPREGKAVEINALWYNFLRLVEYFCRKCSDAPGFAAVCLELAEQTKNGFKKFWIEDGNYLSDVIRRDGSKDNSVRPNMLIALSLQYPILDREHGHLLLSEVEKQLLTPYGLRTLAPTDPAYCGQYGGGKDVANQWDRDVTYHQGTVWPWLLGPWVDARLFVYGSTKENLDFIGRHFSALEKHTLYEACVGSVSEIFDGDPPHKARGCFAQAWSVAELLRVLKKIEGLKRALA